MPKPLDERYAEASMRLQEAMRQVETVFIGQTEVVKLCFAAMVAGGHILLEGPPSVGKTTLVKAIAQTLGGKFRRIQGTPDLMPGDITGSVVRNLETGRFEIQEGPVFTDMLLFDEINRAPPKVHSALLEAMEEKTVTLNGETRPLSQAFFVAATQNPIDNEGVYPLTEANKDRFMMRVDVDYPDRATEIKIATGKVNKKVLTPVFNVSEIIALREMVDEIELGEDFSARCVDIVRMTRPKSPENPQFVKDKIDREGSLRASTNLVRISKVLAMIEGREHPDASDLKRIAYPLLRHRLSMRNSYGNEDSSFNNVVGQILMQHGIK